ncbi:hypothetical protein [Longimicrobium sp.]|uniref:hypothetical protein n=1 Tax=Longimicrobium sp. TaxID=2029185 RepID=UPI002B9A2C4A|nr:hypothetical protein [Longimicrobium sp.]HSU13042.1 hypothetical protein [Longimicrobium sp.]
MELALDKLNAEDVLHQLIGMAAGQIPVAGGFVNYLVDTVLFPKPDVDIWAEMEGRVQGLVGSRLDEMVASLGANNAANLFARLRAFGNELRQFAWITDREERKLRLAFMVTQLNAAVAECVALPNAQLLAIPDILRPLSLAHIAVLMEQKALEPHRYEHQAALNHTAIMYSDLAGSLFQRALAWRRAMVAEGKGRLVIEDLNVNEGAQTRSVHFTVYDRFAENRWQPGPHGLPVIKKIADGLRMDRVDVRYADTEQATYKALTAYDTKIVGEYTDLWNRKLLNYTREFMKLVDWPGVEREKKGQAKAERRVLTFPLTIAGARPARAKGSVLDRLDLFLEQQMDQFAIAGPRYAQTYRLSPEALAGEHAVMHTRADTYDTAMACIYFQERGEMARAADLADALVVAQNHDAKGGGRIVAATRADELLDRGMGNTTSVFVHDGGRRDVGNMSWAGLALTRMAHRTGRYRYLHAAEKIGGWMLENCRVADAWGGFSGGEDHWGTKYPWRSVEHNVDAFSFFANLHHLTGDPAWADASASARKLVLACRVTPRRDVVCYVTGTGEKMELNSGVIPTDTQSWTALAGIDPGNNERLSLIYMLNHMDATSEGFAGTKFAEHGQEVQNEATAGAAMALWLRGGDEGMRGEAQRYLDSLTRQITEARNGDGYGVVATPAAEAKTGPGLGWSYFNFLHVASSAWTGLALLACDNPGANPYAPLSAVAK